MGNLHDALELSQEAFVRAYRNLGTLEEQERFGPWLLRIVTNLSLNLRRSRHLRRENGLDNILLHEDEPADAAASDDRPGAQLAADELRQLVERMLAELPDQQRAALVLFSIEGLPQRQVAELLGCSVEAVKWHVFQARKKLKARLAEYL